MCKSFTALICNNLENFKEKMSPEYFILIKISKIKFVKV